MSDVYSLRLAVDEAKDEVLQRVVKYAAEYFADGDYELAYKDIDDALDKYVNALNELVAYEDPTPKSSFFLHPTIP
ncbi:hypothetical protein [Actinomadura sp. WMMB 499]|uniref:hypothetical protein n=1 Tax=Actinomadura sp. WMMB 499 TaxID=1219491 RepID=UPI0012465264|nr:hypothetical protein [Actinomadura sp. WMMB 499]QFG25472.1 hypothetical protein F7P10_34345 [Actinomadura sp. WMMB 499]